jgi:hypothetical protein|tara:strand:+ start:291 stop:737 length:447 start_codon:yes stop_codon:yes gene_type:complete
MKNLVQKSLFTLSVISVLLITGAQAATFSKLIKLGIVNANSAGKEVVIYNDEQTKCLSTFGQKRSRSKSLAYASCRMDDTDTWVITRAGKVKNKRNGKCLSTPTGGNSLVLVHCNYMHFRDYIAHDFIILDHLVDGDRNGAENADIRH